MKKILILAYDFPPYVSVGGLRPYAWYKYFHEFGIYPIVVTRQWGNQYGNHLDYIAPGESNETIVEENETGTIIRTAYKPNLSNCLLLKYGEKRFRLFRKAITAYYEFMQFIFCVGPKAGLYRGAKQYLKQHKVDAIIATGEPFVLFKYASRLSKKHKIPWIADYRDPWTQNKTRSANFILKKRNQFFEKKYLSNVKFITTVSSFLKFQIKKQIKNKQIHINPNGYFIPQNIVFNKQRNSQSIDIAFAGSIYPWHPYRSFLECLNKVFLEQNLSIHLTFYGVNIENELKNLINKEYPSIQAFIHFHPKVVNEVLLSKLQTHNVLLLFNDYSISGTKIYDYLAVQRRILLCFINDLNANNLKNQYFPIQNDKNFSQTLQADILDNTKAGYSIENSEMLCQILNDMQKELFEKGEIICQSQNIDQYSRKKQVERLAALLS